MTESAIGEIRRLCREADPAGDDPLVKAAEKIGEAACRLASPEAVQQLARAAGSGAAQRAGELARAHMLRTALLAALALAVAVGAGFWAGYAARGGLRSVCLDQGRVQIEPKSGHAYCVMWLGEER